MKINGDLKFRTLGSGELQNAIIERVAGGALGGSLPTGAEGRIAFNTDTNTYWFYGGSQWNEFGGGGDISNIIDAGGFMNQPNGTFNAAAFDSFTNVDNAGSPFANLVDALAQLDAAISTAAGVDTLEELTDTTISSPTTGQLLYYKDVTDEWTQTSVTALSDGDVLTWNNSAQTWEPTEKSAVASIEDLTDVSDTATSAASDGQVLRFDSGAAVGDKWSAEDLGYIAAPDGNTFVTLTGTAGSINPRTDGNNINFYIDVGGTATRVGTFDAAELDITAVGGTTGGAIDINAGSNSSGAGGNVTIDGGQGTGGAGGDINLTAGAGDTTEGGDVNITAGSGQNVVGSGDVTITGGSNGTGIGARLLIDGGGVGVGGDVILNAGDGGASDGNIYIYSNTNGLGTGTIELKTAGVIDLESPYASVTNTTAASAGVVRYQEGTTNGSNWIGLQAPNAVGSSVTWALPEGLGSPDDAVYVLGVDTLTAGGTHQTKWVSATSIGGNSFATWSNSGGTGDASIVADTTSATVTLVSEGAGGGVTIDFDAPTDTITFGLTTQDLATANAVTGSDLIWFDDGGPNGTPSARTFTNVLADLDIPNGITANGIVVRTAADTYASRTITASAVNDELGIAITNGNGVSGNPTVGLDVVGLTDIGSTPQSVDELIIYDVTGTVNRKVTVGDLTAGIVGAGLNLTDLENVTVTDAQPGDILYVTDGSPEMWENAQPGAGTGVQPYDASLASIAGLSLTANDFIYVTDGSPETFSTLASGTIGRDLLGDETQADARTTLGLVAGGTGDIWVEKAGDTMTGNLVMSSSAEVQLVDGSAANPSLTFASDTNSGVSGGSDTVVISTAGAARITASAAGNTTINTGTLRVPTGTGAAPTFTFTGNLDTGLFSVEADILGVTAGGAERLRVYGKDYEISGSPGLESTTGAISVENTASYEALIGDPAGSGFTAPVDDFLPNAQWVDLYYLRKSGGTMSGDIILDGNDINMAGGSITNLAAPTGSLDATNKNYVDNLVSSGTVWVNPVENPDLVGIADDEPDDPLPSGMYIAYGGASYPQQWSLIGGSPVGGSPSFIEVNEYDLMHYTFGQWEKSGTLQNGTRLLAGVFTDAIDTKTGQNLDGTGIFRDDIVQYIGFDGSPSSNPFDPNNWDYPHGRAGGVKFDVVSVTSSTKTFVIEGDVTASFKTDNTFTYDSEGSPAGSGSPFNDGLYTIDSVTFTGPNTEVVVEEAVPGDGTGGTAEPEIRNGITTLTSNSDDSHFGQSYLYVAASNEWVQISGPGNVDAGIGLSYQGNTLNVNLGAGIFEQPGDEVGIELYNAASGGLVLTTDGSTRGTGTDTRLHLLLSASGGLDQGTQGLFISSGGVTNDMLENGSGINISGDAGTPTDIPLGSNVTFDGTDGVVVTVSPGGSPLGTDTTVTIDLDTVPNSALENSSFDVTDGNTTRTVDLGDTITAVGGIVGAEGAGSPLQGNLKFRRIEDADGDTYVQVSTGPTNDSDTVSAVGGTASLTLSSAEADLTGSVVDINATGGAATIDASTTVTVTGGTGATLTATTGNATVSAAAAAGNVYLTAGASGNVDVRSNRELRLRDADNSAYIGHKSNATVSSSITYEWPEAPAGNDYVLVSSTGGVMSWASPSTVGRTRIEDLDDVVVNVGSPGEGYIAGQVLVASGGSPNQLESQAIQYIYDSTLTTPTGSPETTAASSHTINHNLGQKYVNVTVYNGSDQQIIPQSVTLDSANAITVTFNSAIDCVVVIMGVPGVSPANGA